MMIQICPLSCALRNRRKSGIDAFKWYPVKMVTIYINTTASNSRFFLVPELQSIRNSFNPSQSVLDGNRLPLVSLSLSIEWVGGNKKLTGRSVFSLAESQRKATMKHKQQKVAM